MKNFTSVHDVEDVAWLCGRAFAFKEKPEREAQSGRGKTLGLIFLNPSLRTRLSTQLAAQNLGMNVIVLNVSGEGWKLEFADGTVMDGPEAEHVREAAAVIGEYCDIIGLRAFAGLKDRERDYREELLQKFIEFSDRPVISLESATRHPLQSLADLLTIEELKRRPNPKVVLTWAPHPNPLPQAVANSFCEWMLRADVELVVSHPPGYELAEQFVEGAVIEYDQRKAFSGADFIYAKNWSAFGEYGAVLNRDPDWMITAEKMELTDNARFMHCLPVRRNVVVEDAVLDSPASVVVQQAGNRVWAAQAVLSEILSETGRGNRG
ncbi:MAG: N-acetylornithine carbamoyltransferase [Chlorobi bacterium]|nr:N-acetylornithine carbamoyltransferase [Chlorobiota bacterium]